MQPPAESAPEESEERAEARLEREERRWRIQAQCNQRIFLNFVRRYLRGLGSARFQELVGPVVMAKNYVIFGHLLLQLSKTEWLEGGHDFLVEAFLTMWRSFWGDPGGPGYYSRLVSDDRRTVREVVGAHLADSVLLASLIQSRRLLDGGEGPLDKALYRVRDVWRALLTNLPFELRREALREAWALVGESEGDAEAVVRDAFGELEGLAKFEPAEGLLAYLEDKYGLQRGSCDLVKEDVSKQLSKTPLYNLLQPGAHAGPAALGGVA